MAKPDNNKNKRKEKKELRRKKREIRNDKCRNFFKKYQKPIAIAIIVIYSIGTLTVFCSSIAGLIFANDDVIIGDLAPNILEYDKPASKIFREHTAVTKAFGLDKEYDIFQQGSLPLGNGDLAASVLGETDNDKLIINEKTLWSGGPIEGQKDYNGDNFLDVGPEGFTEAERYHKIQSYLLAGDEKSATKLFENRQDNGDNSGDYLAWGNVVFYTGHKNVKNYYRSLDIDNAISNVSYNFKGEKFTREYFVSNPKNVIAIKLTAENNLDINIGFEHRHANSEVVAKNDYLCHFGKLENGLKFYCYLKINPVGGDIEIKNNTLHLTNTKSAYIYISAATDYKQEFPIYRTGESENNLKTRVEDTVNAALNTDYDILKQEHVLDYRNLFDRVKLNFGGVKPNFTTDKLISRNKTIFLYNSNRRYLEQLLFNYGRYLLISSSRENSQLPANLQGVWNQTMRPAWGSDYHININLQMNYWPSYNTNLVECATPLVTFVDKLREPGRITAKTYTASQEEIASGKPDNEYGFIANTECNPYGHTAPCGGEFSRALWSPGAVAWLMQNLYEKYEYTLDKTYLEYIYPIMKEALLFFERTMVEYNGRLVTAPAYSPEHGPITAGNTYEQTLVWQLVTDTINAANVLHKDPSKVVEWESMKSKLKPLEIGIGGQLKEWYDETYILSKGQPNHRHMSHLLGLFPGDLINKDSQKEIVDAVKTTLKWRGKKSTGWAMGQRINTYARLNDGHDAYDVIQQLFKNGIYKNLFDAHPPFQIDGNFGYTSGVSEMLMQSNLGYIDLLPAIPDEWAQGYLSGIKARGNFDIQMEWKNKEIARAIIRSNMGAKAIIKLPNVYNYKVLNINDEAISFIIDNGKICFDTVVGMDYKLVTK